MKILYTNHIITPYLHALLEKLSAHDCQSVMLLPENDNDTVGKGVKQNDAATERSYRIRYSRSKKNWYGKAVLTDLKAVLLQEKPDILVIVFPYFIQLFFNRKLLKLLRKNNIRLAIREIPFQTPPFGKFDYFKSNPIYNENMELQSRGLSFRLRVLLLMYIRRFVYSKADAALCYTTQALQVLPSYGINPQKIFVTCNTSDTDALFASREKVMQSPPLLPKRKRILHIGRLVKWKRVDLLIQAFQTVAKKHPDSELMIIGNGPEKETLMQQVVDAGLTRKVVFAGAIYDADTLGKYMYESSVYVLAGMGGLSINDAMCYSLPVICSICDGTEKDLITDGVNGYFFKEGDVESLAEKIMLILSDDTLRLQMGEAAYRVIKEKINSDTVAQRYMRAFEHIIN